MDVGALALALLSLGDVSGAGVGGAHLAANVALSIASPAHRAAVVERIVEADGKAMGVPGVDI